MHKNSVNEICSQDYMDMSNFVPRTESEKEPNVYEYSDTMQKTEHYEYQEAAILMVVRDSLKPPDQTKSGETIYGDENEADIVPRSESNKEPIVYELAVRDSSRHPVQTKSDETTRCDDDDDDEEDNETVDGNNDEALSFVS